MVSRTKIKLRIKKKTNPEIQETIAEALKTRSETWIKIAALLSGSTSGYSSINLDTIAKETKAGDTVVIVGKVISKGTLSNKVRIAALSFSESALEKLKESKSETVSILEEIKKNKEAKGIKIIR